MADVLTYQERAAQVMYHLCTHDGNGGHGYSQYARWGDGTFETLVLTDGTQVVVPNGDFDCSSACISAWEAVLPGSTGSATYTGNMIDGFTETGLFLWEPWESDYVLSAGDVLLNVNNHAAMCIDYQFTVAEFSISELGTIYGQQGDQTGWESKYGGFYQFGSGGWDGILHYVGPQPEGVVTDDPGIPENNTEEDIEELEVDGYWGELTTIRLQQYFGTYVDGVISHQWADNAQPACTGGWDYDDTEIGSNVVRALQAMLHVETDGIIGKDTISELQEYLGVEVTGTLEEGCDTIKELQRRLNKNEL